MFCLGLLVVNEFEFEDFFSVVEEDEGVGVAAEGVGAGESGNELAFALGDTVGTCAVGDADVGEGERRFLVAVLLEAVKAAVGVATGVSGEGGGFGVERECYAVIVRLVAYFIALDGAQLPDFSLGKGNGVQVLRAGGRKNRKEWQQEGKEGEYVRVSIQLG